MTPWMRKSLATAVLTVLTSLTLVAIKDTREATLSDVQQNQRLTTLEDRYKELHEADIRIEAKLDKILERLPPEHFIGIRAR